jgi:hypothetical protein
MINNFETAQTAPEGQSQIGINFSPYYFDFLEAIYDPVSEITFKHGIRKNSDIGIGVRLQHSYPFLVLNTKNQFLNGKSDGAFLLEGSVLIYDDPGSIFTLRPTLLLSQEKPHQFPFRLALGAHLWGDLSGSESNIITSLVANVGFPIRFGSNRKFRLMPDIGFLYPWAGRFIAQCGLYLGYVGNEKK